MTYEPLHHKYRPQTFADLVGQEAIATTLTNAIRTERIAPAYLFTGSRGTGKTSSARILAKSLNCLKENKPTEHPCGICDVCRGIAKSSTLDVVEIDAASNTGVDNIRELIERAQFAPMQCRYKVYVIDECHQLSGAAFNALLKTLEEPPKHVIFVLATTDPQRVLPTIISRCQKFDFRRIPLESMVAHLKKIAKAENINITDEAITLIAQVAQGGLRDAQSLLDQLSLLIGEVTVERVWDLVGAVPERDLMGLLQAIASDNAEAVLEKARSLMDRGREPLIVLQNLAGFYRDLLIAKTAPNRNDLVAVTSPTWNAMCQFVEGWDAAIILTGQKHLKDSEMQLKNTTQPRLWLEMTLLGLLPSANAVMRHEGAALSSISSRTSSHNCPQNGHSLANHQPELKPTTHSTAPANNNMSRVLPTQQMPQEQISPPIPTPIQCENAELSSLETQPAPRVSSPQKLETESEVQEQQADLDRIWQKLLAHLPLPSRALFSQHGHLLAFKAQEARIGIRAPKLAKMAQAKLADIEVAFLKTFNQKVKVLLVESELSSTQTASTNPQQSQSVFNRASELVSPSLGSSYSVEAHGRAERQAVQEIEKSPNIISSPLLPAPEAKEETKRNNWVTSLPTQMPSNIHPQARVEGTKTSSTAELTSLSVQQAAEALQPPASKVPDLGDDEVTFAAQNFAKFFNAEIINLSDELEKKVEAVNLQPLPKTVVTEDQLQDEIITDAGTTPYEDEDIPF